MRMFRILKKMQRKLKNNKECNKPNKLKKEKEKEKKVLLWNNTQTSWLRKS